MNQDEIAVLFRQQEIARREARRKIILNAEELAREALTPKEQAIHQRAVAEIRRAQERLEEELRPKGYWPRLRRAAREFWNALWRIE